MSPNLKANKNIFYLVNLFYYQQYHENGQYIIQIIKIDYVLNLKK